MLTLRNAQRQQTQRANSLALEVAQAHQKMQASAQDTAGRLATAAQFRDPETGAHLQRMSHYAKLVAVNLGLSEKEQDAILQAAPLHDVGKIGIPDHILLKPGRLDEQEMAIMRTHAAIGAAILKDASSPLMQHAAAIALSHHEKYDGSGYPQGLKGDSIPLYGRIVAVADVFDALTSSRPYKAAWSFERAVDWLRENSGSHFDPACVEAFLLDQPAIRNIHDTYQDQE
jgi:putative two-component system response regulator